jgi:hypothetical protein
MLLRFVSAAGVGALAIAFVALVLLILPGPDFTLQRFGPIMILWCLAPALWGVWAMLTPRAWFPERLPWWGAIFGFLAAILGAVVLNFPSRIFGVELPAIYRAAAGILAAAIYYALWIAVRAVCLRLTRAA